MIMKRPWSGELGAWGPKLRKFFSRRLRNLRKLDDRGWTLVELMLTTALIALITPVMALLFLKVSQAMTADEMRGQITHGNQVMMSRVLSRLAISRHFYQGGASNGISFVSAVQFAAGSPATVAGTLLAQVQPGPSLDPSVPGYSSTVVGNSLFFAAYDYAQTFSKGSTWDIVPAPLTIQGTSSNAVTDGQGTPMTFVVDLYRFYYYYLTPSTHPMPAEGVSTYGLAEWQSTQFADYLELNSIQDPSAQNLAVSFIMAQGVSDALDVSQEALTQALYTIGFNTPVNSSSANFTAITSGITIPQASATVLGAAFTVPVTYLCQVMSGIVSRGFGYGISPNTANWANAPSADPVPIYATASGLFPGGFEVQLIGPPAGRQVMIRSSWVAKGAAPKIAFNALTSIQTIKDNW